MTVIALASVKGAPGVTTAATALAAAWPEGRPVLLVEADPSGGDLAPRYGTSPTGGLGSLFAAARRSLEPDDVWDHVDHLPGGLPVLFGLGGMHQATANGKAWPIVAEALAALDADVVVDVGRLLPDLGGGVREIVARADVLLVLCPATLEAIVRLREALPALAAELRGRSLLVVPTGTPQFSAADIGRTLTVEVLDPVPDDPSAAAALANRRAVRRLERTRLLRWAAGTVVALGIEAAVSEAVVPEASEESAEGSEDTPFLPDHDQLPGSSDHGPSDAPPDRTGVETRLAGVGAGSAREVVR